MVTAQIFTESAELTSKSFDDASQAERYAMAILGRFTAHGTICLVRVTDSMTGETSEMEY